MNASELPVRFGRNALSNSVLTGVLAAVALVTTPILTGHLGPERYGIWIFVGSTVAYVELLDLGFGGAVVSFVARFSAAGDDDTMLRTLNTSFFVLAVLGLVALAVIALAAQFLPDVVHLRSSLSDTTRQLLLLLGFDVAVSIPMDTFGCGLVALQRYDLLNASLLGVGVAQAAAWTVVLLTGGGLLLLGIVTVAISLAGQGVRYVLLRRCLPNLSISLKLVDRALLRKLARPAGWYALAGSIDGFSDYANVLVLGIVRNVATAGAYAVAEKLAFLGTKVGMAVVDPYFPHAAALVGRGDQAGLKDATLTGSRIAAGVMMPFCLVVAVFARPGLVAWVGPSFERATPAVVILAVAASLGAFDAIAFKILSGSGGQKLLSLMGLAEATTNIVLTAVLGYYFGLTGVAVALLATVLVVEIGVTLPLVGRRLHIGMLQLFLPLLRAHVVPLVISGSVGWYLSSGPVSHFVRLHGRFANMAVVAVAGSAVLGLYAAIFAVTGLDRDTRQAVMDSVPLARHRSHKHVGTPPDRSLES